MTMDINTNNKNLYRHIFFENSPDSLLIIDQDGKIIDVNPAAEVMTGYCHKELIGTDFARYFSDHEELQAVHCQMLRKECVPECELTICHKNGQLLPVLYKTFIYRQKTGPGADVLLVIRAITERKIAEVEENQRQRKWNRILKISQQRTCTANELSNFSLVEEIYRLTYFDSLTGLPNRVHLDEYLNIETEKAALGNSFGAVLYVALDNFKTINNVIGQSYGNKVIVAVVNQAMAAVGEDAYVSRIGNDEFVIVLPGKINRIRIIRAAEKVITALNREYDVSGSPFHLNVNVGITTYPDDGTTAEEVMKNAGSALYAAKKSGKNCLRFYEKAMLLEVHEKILLISSLRRSIECRELYLHYQPQVTPEGTVVGFEALLRWNSHKHGSVPPAQFIPLAEASGTILPIGEWVLREACMFARSLADMGRNDIYVAVNVSPFQLATDDFVDIIRNCVAEAGIAPNQLEIEITENAMMNSIEDSACKLKAISELGVRISIDDFGTGYSSLTYLQRLPVVTLKIDKTFIETIANNAAQSEIIGSIIDMAHILDMKVIAEGVETNQQFEHLVRCRCDCIQGYLVSRPVRKEDALRFLSEQGFDREKAI